VPEANPPAGQAYITDFSKEDIPGVGCGVYEVSINIEWYKTRTINLERIWKEAASGIRV
jgi:hypothetical protein